MSETVRESITTFSCPGCGGRPVWDPGSGQMKCPFCGTMSAIAQDRTTPAEYDLNSAPDARAQNWGEAKYVVSCKACGAQTILGKDESASLCPFCGSPHVLDDQSAAGIAPESILPFRVTQDNAVGSFRQWLRGKFFAPGKAKKMAALGQISGVYLPHWTYDSDTVSQYTGQEGHHYYVDVPVVVERDGKRVTEMRKEQRTRWEPTSGTVAKQFDDLVVAGSERLPEGLLSRVQPYDLKQLCRYQPGFLAGFSAEKPAVDVQTGWKKAQARIEQTMQSLAFSDILTRADEARVTSVTSRHNRVRYKLTLLPMYLSSFTYKGAQYHVLVNGQTGKCGGEAPVSALRVILVVLIVAALIAGMMYLMSSGEMPVQMPVQVMTP